MMLLEEVLVCGGVSFHPPPCTSRVGEGIRVRVTRVGAVPGLPVNCLVSSVVGGVEVRPPLGDLGRALFSQAVLVLCGITLVSPLGCRTKGLPSL